MQVVETLEPLPVDDWGESAGQYLPRADDPQSNLPRRLRLVSFFQLLFMLTPPDDEPLSSLQETDVSVWDFRDHPCA